MRRIFPGPAHPLHDTAATRRMEHAAAAQLPPGTLMQRAGLATAQLAQAVAPHARRVWIACGPGNNGGDGLEAALQLRQRGWQPVVTWLGAPDRAPPDAAQAWQRAQATGVTLAAQPPDDVDLCIDALLGLGAQRPPEGEMAAWIGRMNSSGATVLAVDLPTGLHADHGTHIASAEHTVRAHHTLSLLTLKPGLFMGQGRDAAGCIWLDTLGIDNEDARAARLNPAPAEQARAHASHKGSRGDVAVIGGAPGMAGAAVLAAQAALHGGAGRVYLALLDANAAAAAALQPELMQRSVDALDLGTMAVACGCGGGHAVRGVLARTLSRAHTLVLDADALNAIAHDPQLQMQVRARGARDGATVITPHPLEAARLLGSTTAEVQADRLAAAHALAQKLACVAVLKGSGTVIAAPDGRAWINPTGNGRLATAGTGDVLAGWMAAQLAAGLDAAAAACAAVYRHGRAADTWPAHQPLTASRLAAAIRS